MKRLKREIVLEEINDPRSPWFEPAMKLFEEVFPPEERLNREALTELLAEKRLGLIDPFNIHFLIARCGETLCGFCQGSYLAIQNVCFVAYLAVNPGYKGTHVAARLRERLIRECRRDAVRNRRRDIWAVVGEVEAGNPWLSTLVQSRGAIALDIVFEQPALSPETKPVPLVLYVQRHDRAIPSLPARDVRRLVYAIYRRVYRIRYPLQNDSFRRTLASLDGRHRVGQKKLPAAAEKTKGGKKE